jgi:hypothetical protein
MALAKQAAATEVIDDTIFVVKSGYLNCSKKIISNSDSAGIEIKMVTQNKIEAIKNAFFELESGGMSANWSTNGSGSKFTWEKGLGMDGSNCISIESLKETGASWRQSLQLTPGKHYILRGYVKGKNITQTDNYLHYAANLFVNTQAYSPQGASLYGNFDWRLFEVDFLVPISGTVEIACRLGYDWGTAKGKVYFDNLEIVEDNGIVKIEGKHINLLLESEDVVAISPVNLKRWLDHLDKTYEAYNDLVGSTPFNGTKIDILSTHYSLGGWAVAGNPIKWMQPYVGTSLSMSNNMDDWSFGILHEIGHDFDIGGWNWDGEFWANTKMYYTIETLNGRIPKKNGVDFYVGSQLSEMYKTVVDGYDNTIAKGNYHHDALTYCFIRIKNKIGWQPFKQTFRHFTNTGENPSTGLAKFNRFIELLQQNYNPGGNEIESTFLPGELDIIRTGINGGVSPCAAGHDFPNTCGATKCKWCSATRAAKDHDWYQGDNSAPFYCRTCGVARCAEGHNFPKNCGATKCNWCPATRASQEHQFSSDIDNQNCTFCGELAFEFISEFAQANVALNVYRGPSSSYTKIGSIGAEEYCEMMRTPQQNNYVKIKYNTLSGFKEGYVPRNSLTVSTDNCYWAVSDAAQTVYGVPVGGSETAIGSISKYEWVVVSVTYNGKYYVQYQISGGIRSGWISSIADPI